MVNGINCRRRDLRRRIRVEILSLIFDLLRAHPHVFRTIVSLLRLEQSHTPTREFIL